MTQEELKKILRYNSGTGAFVWRIRGAKYIKFGSKAGCIDRKGYWTIKINGKAYRAHRLAWLYVYGNLPVGELDHKNRRRSDNRISNLRLASRLQNAQNHKIRENTTGYRGVHLTKSGRYQAQVRANKGMLSLGTYATSKEAGVIAATALRELHGEFFSG